MNKKSSVQNLVSRVAHRLALRSDSSALFAEEKARPLVIEALEPRILFSGSPAPAEPAPAESNTVQESPAPAEADASANPAPAQDATVAAPPEATVPAPEGSADQGDTSVALTDAELFSLTDAALGIWAGSGISEGQAAALANATYRIADLGGNILGSAEGNVITIDDDAAGRGWFVDSTPEDNSEFVLGGSATTSIDLLSILLHEQGHLLGLDDVEGSGDITNLMNGIFVEGERRLPVAGQAVGAVAGSLEGVHYAEWNVNSNNANWNVDANWVNPGTFPNGIDAVADFSKLNITGHHNVNVEQPITIGSLIFGDTNDTHDYNLQPGTAGTLTFDVSSGDASIVKISGRNQHIYAPISLNDNLDVTNNGSGALYLRGGVNNNGNDITFDGSGTTRFQDATAGISGSGDVIKNGSGLLVLGNGGTNPTHTYTGQTIVNGGIVMFQSANKAAGNFTLDGGMLTDYYRSTTIFSSGLGTGTNQIQIYGDSGFGGGNGNSNWRIGANNSTLQWGSTYFDPTSLKFLTTADNMGPSIYGTVTLQNGLDLNGGARTIDVLGTGADPSRSQATIAGVIQDTAGGGGGSLVKTGAGQLVLNSTNTFTGGVAINQGSVRVGNNSGLGNGGPLAFTGSGTTLDLRASPTVSALSGTGTNGLITAGAAGARTLTVNQSTDTVFGGVIEDGLGTVSLVKSGNGALELAGASTFTGGINLSGGTLLINGNASGATGAISVNNTSTFGGGGTVGGTVTVASGANLAPGAAAVAGTLTLNNTLDIQGLAGGPGTLNFDLDALASANDLINVTSGPALIGTGLLGFSDFNFNNLGGLEVGTYTLMSTTAGLIVGTLDGGDLTGTIGSFDAEVRIFGNSIVLDVLPPAGPATAYWDGTDTSVEADGGNGTWNTTATNWDDAALLGNSVVWDADGSGNDTAIFGGTTGTVTVNGSIDLKDLSFNTTSTTSGYTISGGTLNFAPDGTINNLVRRTDHTISSIITGSPTVNIDDNDGANYKGLTFAPNTGTQTLGVINLPTGDALSGGGDKGGITLGGSTAGNTVNSIKYNIGSDRYADVNKQGSSTWSVGNINTGTIKVTDGTLILSGTAGTYYNEMRVTGGTVTGEFTIFTNDRRSAPYIASGGTVAPGAGIGTITVEYGTSGGTPTVALNDYSFSLRTGSSYEWEVGSTATDTIDITEGGLILQNFTLKIQDAGGTAPTDTDQLAVFTYDTGVTVDMTGFGNTAANFDVSGAGAGWDANSLTLIDDGAGTIYLTGLPTLDAGDDDYTTSDPTDEDTVLNISAPGVLANDNPTDATITASDATSTEGASVTVNPDGSFSYDPTAAPGIQALSDGQMVTDTFTYTISDDGGATTDSATVSIKVNGLNDAPALSGSNDFEPVAMDDTDNMGQLVSELIGTITDVDDLSVEGIAVTAASSSDPLAGKFQFDAGSGWMDVGAVSESDALLLRATDSLRFLPSGSGSATGTLSFKAWDQTGTTAGQQGTKMTTLPDGSTEQTSAFSGETETVSAAIVNVIIEDGVLIIAEGTGRNDRVTISTSADMLNVIIHDAAGPVVAADPAWQVDANTVSIPIVEFDDIEFYANDGDDFITLGGMGGFTGSLTIMGEEGFDEVVVANGASISLGADENLRVDGETFRADLDSSVSVLGDGTIDILAAGGSGDFAGLNLRRASLSSEGGGITLTGVGGDTGNTNDGVVLTHGSTVSTGGGGVTITGTATSTTGANDGISLKGGSDITAGGAGGITLAGTSSGVNSSYGVQLFSGTEVTTAGGDIAITGASTAGGSRNAGIYTNGATVTAGGAGSVTMTGTGGGAGSNNNGLSLAATAVDAGTSGDVTLVGLGGGGTSGNGGVQVGTGTSVSAGGGNVTITGTGGAGTGVRNTGVSLLSGSSVSSGAGTAITGVAGTGTSRNGGVVLTSATVAATGNLTVDGTGNGTGSYNSGISSSGSTLGGAEVMLAGTGSTSSSTGRFNDGVSISKGGVTASGTLTIDAAGGTGSRDNRGLFVSRAVLGGTLALTGSADTGSGARSTGVFIQNSVLSDDGTIEGTGGGVGGADGFGVYMRNITGGANLNVTTTPDTDEEKGGNYFDGVLPAFLLLGAGCRTKARRGAVGASVLDDELQGRIGAAWGGIRGNARTADALRTQSRLGASLLG